MQQLSPQDAQFLYMETDDNLTHVTSISIFDPATVPGARATGASSAFTWRATTRDRWI